VTEISLYLPPSLPPPPEEASTAAGEKKKENFIIQKIILLNFPTNWRIQSETLFSINLLQFISNPGKSCFQKQFLQKYGFLETILVSF
jgi:hypothetical protein